MRLRIATPVSPPACLGIIPSVSVCIRCAGTATSAATNGIGRGARATSSSASGTTRGEILRRSSRSPDDTLGRAKAHVAAHARQCPPGELILTFPAFFEGPLRSPCLLLVCVCGQSGPSKTGDACHPAAGIGQSRPAGLGFVGFAGFLPVYAAGWLFYRLHLVQPPPKGQGLPGRSYQARESYTLFA